jgi:hypothetical protein
MKPNQKADGDETLDQILRTWELDVQLPVGFQELVWQRISRLAPSRRSSTVWMIVSRWLEVSLPRPRIALSYAVILVGLGLAGGALAAQIQNKRLNVSLGARYVQALDPYHKGFIDR